MNNSKKDVYSSAFFTFKGEATFKNEVFIPVQRSTSTGSKLQNRSKNKEEPETDDDYIYRINKYQWKKYWILIKKIKNQLKKYKVSNRKIRDIIDKFNNNPILKNKVL